MRPALGLSILGCLGLTELVAYSPQEYVATAVRLAADPIKAGSASKYVTRELGRVSR